jgi:lipoic acid synthetase
VVITSVDRDDLRDGGSRPFRRMHPRDARAVTPTTQIEILVPDFRGRDDRALDILKAAPPDVMNHNLETVPAPVQGGAPRLGLRQFSLNLLKQVQGLVPGHVPPRAG